jgi:hypothetical protein
VTPKGKITFQLRYRYGGRPLLGGAGQRQAWHCKLILANANANANAKQMLKWGVKRQLILMPPLSDINAKEDLQIKTIAGSRSLSDEEIRQVWKAIEQQVFCAP